jgi:hypothetical protein
MAKPARSELAAMRRAKSAQRTAAFKTAAINLVGDAQLKQALQGLADKVTKTAVQNGLRACVKEFADGIKQQVPTRQKNLKRLIGSGLTKAKYKKQGAKAGFAVAGASKKVDPKRSGKNVTKAGKLKGVGLGARNVMWAALGTKRRTVKKTRMYRGGKLVDVTNWNTGEMPPILGETVRRGVQSKQAAGIKVMEIRIWADIVRKVAKDGKK